jgi:hypothetical protein
MNVNMWSEDSNSWLTSGSAIYILVSTANKIYVETGLTLRGRSLIYKRKRSRLCTEPLSLEEFHVELSPS